MERTIDPLEAKDTGLKWKFVCSQVLSKGEPSKEPAHTATGEKLSLLKRVKGLSCLLKTE